MMDEQMSKHFLIHTNNSFSYCNVCNLQVLPQNINKHLKTSHPKCCSCQKHFIDLQQLRLHEPNCNQLKTESHNLEASNSNEIYDLGQSLNIDNSK